MVGGKGKVAPPSQPGVYRDDPDRDDAASVSSAVLMGEIDAYHDEEPAFPDEELPPYQDAVQQGFQLPPGPPTTVRGSSSIPDIPSLPKQVMSTFGETVSTLYPDYSTDAKQLCDMIKQQAAFPPNYHVQILGKHTERVRQGNKESKNEITDFNILLDLTHLLWPPNGGAAGELESLPNGKRGYRGGRIISRRPEMTLDGALREEILLAWCERFVADRAKVKTFTMKREIMNHDTKKLEQLLLSAANSTNYRGHTTINFGVNHRIVEVHSPGKLSEWRTTKWIRWFFYCTFLWIFAWPVLFLLTHRYAVIKVIYPYADAPPGDERRRTPTVMTEAAWFNTWENAIRRAILARMDGQGKTFLDDEYRLATAEADARGALAALAPPPAPSTGNALADSAFGLLGAGLRVASQYQESRGWGGDC